MVSVEDVIVLMAVEMHLIASGRARDEIVDSGTENRTRAEASGESDASSARTTAETDGGSIEVVQAAFATSEQDK